MNRREFIPLGLSPFLPLAGCTSTNDFSVSALRKKRFTVEDYRVTSANDSTAPISFHTRVVDDVITEASPATVRFVLENETRHSVFVSSSPDPPFGMNYAIPAKYSDAPNSDAAIQASILLWQEDYNTNRSGVAIRNHGDTMNVEASDVITRIEPNENISQTFQFRHEMENLSAKKYFIDVVLGYGFDSNHPSKQPIPSQFGSKSLDTRISFEVR